MPVLTASAPMSVTIASICDRISEVGSSRTSVTPPVFCAVIAVMAEVPYTPMAAKVFRSACIPAPPPESDPAIVIARGVFFEVFIVLRSRGWWRVRSPACRLAPIF